MVFHPRLSVLDDVDGVLEYFPGVGDDLVGPELVRSQGYCADAVAQAEDYQFGLWRWGDLGSLSRRCRGGRRFLLVVETPAH